MALALARLWAMYARSHLAVLGAHKLVVVAVGLTTSVAISLTEAKTVGGVAAGRRDRAVTIVGVACMCSGCACRISR